MLCEHVRCKLCTCVRICVGVGIIKLICECMCMGVFSLFPKPFPIPVFGCLQYTEREGLGDQVT